MSAATALLDDSAVVAVTACEWCGDALSSPYLRRHDGVGLHVACAKHYARAQAASPPR
jgi:hypothetical protein